MPCAFSQSSQGAAGHTQCQIKVHFVTTYVANDEYYLQMQTDGCLAVAVKCPLPCLTRIGDTLAVLAVIILHTAAL